MIPVVLGVLGLGTAGTAYAALRYDRSHAGLILPGVKVQGVDVSGMTRAQAIRAVVRAAGSRDGIDAAVDIVD